MDRFPISSLRVPLLRGDLAQMLRLLALSWKLLNSPDYRRQLESELPEPARFDPGYAAVMMGYDFHLTDAGPRLIEINTNAGGAALALRACRGEPQPTPSLRRRLRRMFAREWADFSGGSRPLRRLVILDSEPQQQALYPEMQRFVDWLETDGLVVRIADPRELKAGAGGVRCDGNPVDMIYNRHCDFYLEDETLAGIRAAYLARRVCVTPNPFVYGHLADKRRLVLWRQTERMRACGLDAAEVELLQRLVPESRLLAALDADRVWSERKSLVFKPVARFGSKGVLLGKGISRKRFAELDPATTLVQELVPPSQIFDETGAGYKVDLRLFAWRDRPLGIAARLYQGQVTNLQTPGGGFAAVVLA